MISINRQKHRTAIRWISAIGGFLGALSAIFGIPGVIYAVWKNSNELLDTFTTPEIVGFADHLTLRCAYRVDPVDEIIDVKKHCLPAPLATSLLLTIENKDYIRRDISDLSAKLTLKGDPDIILEHQWPRMVQHIVLNGKDTVVWSEWRSIGLAPHESTRQELMFQPLNTTKDGMVYEKFINGLLGMDGKKKWAIASIEISSRVVGDDETITILRCQGAFPESKIEMMKQQTWMQNQITLRCSEK